MRILFLGRKQYAANAIIWLIEQGHSIVAVVTDDHNPDSVVFSVCENYKISCITQEAAEKFVLNSQEKIDVIISYLYWKKIREPLITGSVFGCINFHPAPLPDWKGCGGYNIAILNKLDEWGASAHFVDAHIDNGPIIEVDRFQFDYQTETALSLAKKTQVVLFDLFKNVMLGLETGSLSSISNIGGQYISKQQMLDMMEILSDDDIELKIRAFWFPPHQGAYIKINNTAYPVINDFILNQLKDLSEEV